MECKYGEENRWIVCRDYKRMDINEFMRKIDCKSNNMEGNDVNALFGECSHKCNCGMF